MTKEESLIALELLQEAYDLYMSNSASGSFTCNCRNTEQCGTCDLRATVKSFLWMHRSELEGRPCPACDGKGCDYFDLEEREKCFNGVVRRV